MSDPVLIARGVTKVFRGGGLEVPVLSAIDLSVMPGETVAIVGASGSGKSTLLHLLGGLDRPTAGDVSLMGREFSSLNEVQRGDWRNRHLGFVYQFHHLLPEFSALENVAMPLTIAGKSRREAEARAKELLEGLGLGHRLNHQPAQMSGGEQQRVAIARALANRPKLLLADEPTGNLDPATSSAVFQSLYQVCREQGVAAVIATHNMDLARYMDRVVALKDGHLEVQRG